MPTIDNYSGEFFIRLLLQGSPGSGKTTTACRFPGTWIMDCDLNLGGPLRWLRENGQPLPLGYDTIDRDDEGKLVAENMRWQRLVDCLNRLSTNPAATSCKTIVIDSMSKVAEYNKAHVLRTNPTKTSQMEMTSWGFFYNNWVQLVSKITAVKVNFVMTAHDKVDKDELDGSTRIFINVQGQFQAVAGSLFTDVWHSEVVATLTAPPVHKFVLRTIQDYRYVGLKNSFGLPALFEFDWNLIEQKIKGTQS